MNGRNTRPISPISRRNLALAATFLLLFAFWWNKSVPVDPGVSSTASSYVQEQYPNRQFERPTSQQGHFGTYRVTILGRGQDKGSYIVVTVHNTPDGLVATKGESFAGTPGGSALPTLLLITAVFCLLFYLFFQAVPRRFARRCPRDHSILQESESEVLASISDEKGGSRPPIIERVFQCPKCDFRHVDAMPDPHFRPMVAPVYLGESPVISEGMAERMKDEYQRAHPAMSEEEWKALVRQAQARARARTAADSPWLKD